MKMAKPHKGYLRRSFYNGIWLRYRTSAHQTQLHLKLHRLQVSPQTKGDAVYNTSQMMMLNNTFTALSLQTN